MKIRYCVAIGAALGLAGAVAVAATQDPSPPMNAPDAFAWQLFLDVNAATAGKAVTFETWGSDTDLFRPNPKWPAGPTPLSLHPPALAEAQLQLMQLNHQALPAVPPGKGALEETRRNRVTFDFIVNNKLFSQSGLKAAFGKELSLPVDSVEVKGNWMLVSDIPAWTNNRVTLANVPTMFHVNTGADGKAYALVSMHVISKATPNWTWATFENRFNPGRCDILGCKDLFGATPAIVAPSAATGAGYPDCAKTPALKALFAKAKAPAVFQNYCLKGSQVDFTDNTGLSIRLGNSVTEDGFVSSSSCMTCHSRSAWGPDGKPTSTAGFISTSPLMAPTGPIDPKWYWSGLPTPPNQPPPGAPAFTRIATSGDFVWSIPFCAYDDSNPALPKPSRCSGK